MERLYSVILVDDEEDVILTILRRMDWGGMGLLVPRYAHNGLEALEMAEEEAPDIVMTDINMPYMDGLTLTRRLREQYPNIRVIIFSGYDEFEYAREAIRLEAEEYLLKPINASELRESFTRIKNQLDREHDERRNVEKLREYYHQSLPLLREEFYASLIEGKADWARLKAEMEDYRIDLTGPYFCVVVLHADTSRMPDGFNPLLLSVSVRKLAEERLSVERRCRFFSYAGHTVVIAQLDRESDVTRFTDDCDRFCRLAKSVSGTVVTAGIGTVCAGAEALGASYESACNALSYTGVFGKGKAINIAEVSSGERGDETEPGDRRRERMRSFVARAIEYVDTNYANEEINVESVCAYLGVSTAYFSTVFKRETGKTFINYLTDLRMEKAVSLLVEQDEKTYVIARKVGYTDPNYFSYVFKKQFGVSPSRYKALHGSQAAEQ